MQIEFDAAKQARTLAERGLDFADAAQVFAGVNYTVADDRKPYGEERFFTIGLLAGREVVLVWTPRGAARRAALFP
ncbi:BrnT family toxin [Verminephrobacter eiseniae]|uniref:BrnT family toxin n=1 Tax=Verminephrobacter eiseniae TaxID=364317 RepID=UPI002AA2A43A|nr:BrnT family toxin [Verminephrobacter eiseniae]